jgi:hypothetical protein
LSRFCDIFHPLHPNTIEIPSQKFTHGHTKCPGSWLSILNEVDSRNRIIMQSIINQMSFTNITYCNQASISALRQGQAPRHHPHILHNWRCQYCSGFVDMLDECMNCTHCPSSFLCKINYSVIPISNSQFCILSNFLHFLYGPAPVLESTMFNRKFSFLVLSITVYLILQLTSDLFIQIKR